MVSQDMAFVLSPAHLASMRGACRLWPAGPDPSGRYFDCRLPDTLGLVSSLEPS